MGGQPLATVLNSTAGPRPLRRRDTPCCNRTIVARIPTGSCSRPALGTIDPARVCILGGRHGGYAALAAATLQPGVYRCAVSIAGIADLKSFLRREGGGDQASGQTNEATRYWDRYLGIKGADDSAVDAVSPIKHVEAVRIPILLVHGRDDTVVPIEQSCLMLKALQAAHKDAQLVELDGEDHWLSRSNTRLQMLQTTTAFLIAHNPPDPAAVAATSAPTSAARPSAAP